MKKCPYCAESIHDDAVKCRFCGEFTDTQLGMLAGQVEPTPADQAKFAEIRRLQRMASGAPTPADSLRKTKGLLALVIIGAILFYAYSWHRQHGAPSASSPNQSAISFDAFNAIFGPESALSLEEKRVEFANYRGKWVIWNGQIVYINRGEGMDLYISVRHRATTQTSDVLVRFGRDNRTQIQTLRVNERIRYGGKIADYGEETAFITLRNGVIFSEN